MEIINIRKKSTKKSKSKSLDIPNEAIEIVVIEDRKLINMLFSKSIHSAIERIGNLKNFPVKFSSFQSGEAFIKDLENRSFGKSKIIVFTDNPLKNELIGSETLFNIKQKGIDITMIVMSDETEDAVLPNKMNSGIEHIISNKKTNPAITSQVRETLAI